MIVKDWLYSITKRIETEKDEKDCMCKLKAHINVCQDSLQVTHAISSFTRSYITTSFVPKLRKTSFRHFKHLGMGDVTNNYFAESENSALARDPGGPKSSHKLHVSYDAINNHMERRCVFFAMNFFFLITKHSF